MSILTTPQRPILAASGIFFALLSMLPLGFLPPPPSVHSDSSIVISYYQSYGAFFQTVTYIGIIGSGFLLCFICYLASLLREPNRNEDFWPRLLVIAGSIWTAFFILFSSLILSLPRLSMQPVNANLVRFWADITDIGYTVSFLPACIFVLAVTVSTWKDVLLPRWLQGLGIGVAIVQLIATLGLVIPAGILAAGGILYDSAFALLGLWILLVSLICTIQELQIRKLK